MPLHLHAHRYVPAGCVTRNFQEQSTMARAWLGNCPRWTQPPCRRHESAWVGLAPLKGGLSGQWSVSVNGKSDFCV
jgi:hypothetical protein